MSNFDLHFDLHSLNDPEMDDFEIIELDRFTGEYYFKKSFIDFNNNKSDILKLVYLTTNRKTKSEDVKTKKKKWIPICEDLLGFKMMLLPRSTYTGDGSLDIICNVCSIGSIRDNQCSICEYDRYEAEIESKFTYDYEYTNCKLRISKKSKHVKLHKSRKYVHTSHSPICTGMKRHNENYYINHRIYKRSNIDFHHPLKPKTCKNKTYSNYDLHVMKIRPYNCKSKPINSFLSQVRVKHVLKNDNADAYMNRNLVTKFMLIQEREILPEDYDLLLHLDDRVEKKTVKNVILKSFEVEIIKSTDEYQVCTICQEKYLIGESRKILPCGHRYHDSCIDTWLSTASKNCPIDGLPVIL